ncbi:BlaI/MecI/CopY family transcriptional regulator [Streptomyces sp. NPDC058293]|uniref:BlaI/MecI/CopY family transcriptional regulator n=1 Tax=Streptomyces sp. NBC_00119 TaxID=2975659 RepID=A0AAU1UB75_9ACTN|nr:MULTISPECIES: BlaI/MecI/CopY family transcriptional regulator [unclassified Streptomyces]MCX4644152.1 BlaI/MecI/CopY family transcriptional regulator [Streptomyces sp. NBC_01446]MCX5325264.1 BlaI/MecI/CopY family transcriptional regulator [Streptomyces sp. NBC_00120]
MAEEQERRPAGELEASVLAALWAAETPLTPGEVQRALADDLARTTVTTILTRLHAKGTVTRDRAGRGYAYRPAQDAHGLTARRMHAELDKDEDRGTVLARFVSELSTEDEQMLRALLDGGADSGAEGADRGGTGR